jgi:uncharacterized protein YbjT (DUF2867 family)
LKNSDNAVIQALLKDRTFTPRAIVRNPDSDAARNLKAQGVDVKGNGLDKESLVSALRGSEAVFSVRAKLNFVFPTKNNTSM